MHASGFASYADKIRMEQRGPWEAVQPAATVYELLTRTRDKVPDSAALSYQLTSGPKDPAVTLTWAELHARVTQAANLFRRLGIGEGDVVAYLLPNAVETVVALLGGMTAGIVNPINPLLEPEQIAAILRETGAKALVTLRSFPRTDLAQKAARAVELAGSVETVLEVDLNRYLTPPRRWIVPLIRPKNPVRHGARVLDFNRAMDAEPADRLSFAEPDGDHVCAYFHTGGTTGMPKVAQHRHSGAIYNGWLGAEILFGPDDNIICPLPLFHVFAAYPVLMSAVASGAHVVFPTPQGYRGEGVFDNFWKLVERWKINFMITVPTAISQLMQRPVDADISTLQAAFSGSAPLPLELFRRFQEATGVNIIEGYGLTEATCLVSCNPPEGEKRVGSVGVPFPYTDVRILDCDAQGNIRREMDVDEIGEICVLNPGVWPGQTYTDPEKNRGLFANGTHLRTGDLGRIDADGYLWITGRAKDLIIRGGHNIDPAVIEEALAEHPAVAFVGAIGQPDAHAGELPAAYVELVAGASVTIDDLAGHARARITERAAVPKHIEILPELPKTAVGKVFKPELRKMAIRRVYDAALMEAGLPSRVVEVVEDKRQGLVAIVSRPEGVDEAAVAEVLGRFPRPWRWEE